jgi:hydroxypyruvate reductase
VSLREDINKIYLSSLDKLNPSHIVEKTIFESGILEENFERIFPIAFGKAALTMMDGLCNVLYSHSNVNIYQKPIVVTSKSQSNINTKIDINLFISSHPTPDEISIKSSKAVIDYLNQSKKNDLVIFLISGGGSSLLSLPSNNISLDDKIKLTNLLLKTGCSIDEINTIRKHVSDIKGGRLAEFALPSTCYSYIISDVIGDDISSIASGPTIEDMTTFSDAHKILLKYNLFEKIPSSIKSHINKGLVGNIPETPKKLNNINNSIICSNSIMKKESASVASELGYKTTVCPFTFTDEAKKDALNLIKFSLNTIESTPNQKIAIISGGETVVNIIGNGEGGRNQEFALSFLSGIESIQKDFDWILLSVGTDGIDGPTDAAGGIIDDSSILKLKNQNLNIQRYLDNNDSYNFLKKIDSLYKTGPSGTNMADIQILLINPK